MSNDIATLGINNPKMSNSLFRAKNLGTISNLNEYIAFRTAHGIDDKSYKDLYLGDYFIIKDGIYNVEWMVAHFDYYYNRGDDGNNVGGSRGVVLLPRTFCGQTKMNTTEHSTAGGYKASVAHVTTCPAIASALQTVLGSYLLSPTKLITNSVNANIPSMAGAGYNGAATGFEYTTNQCILPNEVQMYGTTAWFSSAYDVGEACQKLAVFNFINQTEYGRYGVWLRSVAHAGAFVVSRYDCVADRYGANENFRIRPLIYIG